jgi:hypothetical protein
MECYVPNVQSSWWWLSFEDNGKNLGVCISAGPTLQDAKENAWQYGCNPGGNIQGWPLGNPNERPRPEYLYKLFQGEAAYALAQNIDIMYEVPT